MSQRFPYSGELVAPFLREVTAVQRKQAASEQSVIELREEVAQLRRQIEKLTLILSFALSPEDSPATSSD